MAAFFQRLIEWWTAPPLAVTLLRDEVASLRAENRRLNDLMTQVYESRGVVPVQPQHVGPTPLPQEQRKSYAEIEAEHSRQDAEDYARFLAEEDARRLMLSQVTSETKPN